MLGYVIPLVKTVTAAAGAGVLGDKHGMTSHGGLLSVVGNGCRSEASGYEIFGVFSDGIQPFVADILPILFFQVKARSKG